MELAVVNQTPSPLSRLPSWNEGEETDDEKIKRAIASFVFHPAASTASACLAVTSLAHLKGIEYDVHATLVLGIGSFAAGLLSQCGADVGAGRAPMALLGAAVGALGAVAAAGPLELNSLLKMPLQIDLPWKPIAAFLPLVIGAAAVIKSGSKPRKGIAALTDQAAAAAIKIGSKARESIAALADPFQNWLQNRECVDEEDTELSTDLSESESIEQQVSSADFSFPQIIHRRENCMTVAMNTPLSWQSRRPTKNLLLT